MIIEPRIKDYVTCERFLKINQLLQFVLIFSIKFKNNLLNNLYFEICPMIDENIVMLAVITNDREQAEVTWPVTFCFCGFIKNFFKLENRRQPRAKFLNFVSSDFVTLPADWNTKKGSKNSSDYLRIGIYSYNIEIYTYYMWKRLNKR